MFKIKLQRSFPGFKIQIISTDIFSKTFFVLTHKLIENTRFESHYYIIVMQVYVSDVDESDMDYSDSGDESEIDAPKQPLFIGPLIKCFGAGRPRLRSVLM
jgi:hypothetical protein